MDTHTEIPTMTCNFCHCSCGGTCEEWNEMTDFFDSFLVEWENDYSRPKKKRRKYKTREELLMKHPPSLKCIGCQMDRKVCDGNPYSDSPCTRCLSSYTKQECIYSYHFNKEKSTKDRSSTNIPEPFSSPNT